MKVGSPTPPDRKAQRTLALWAANCAERVLPLFTAEHPRDDHPRLAIEAARAWVRGEIKCGEARTAALAAHAAARASEHEAARAAARAAGHAAATAHVASHARAAGTYAAKAAAAASSVGEQDWQRQRLPRHLREAMFAPVKKR